MICKNKCKKSDCCKNRQNICNKKTEVYSRIVGYFRPVQNWNEGKKQEFSDRVEYKQENKEREKISLKDIYIEK